MATLLPFLRADAWWIRAFDFPRVQILLLAAVALGLIVACAWPPETVSGGMALATGAAILYQAFRILPYTLLYRVEVADARKREDARTLSLLVANVYTPNRNVAGLLRLVAGCDPDLVLTVETDRWWEEKLDVLRADYPHAVRQAMENTYGMHLYSRLPLVDPTVAFLVEPDVPSIHAQVVLRSGEKVKLHCLHPAPPSPTENESASARDAELLVVARRIVPDEPTIVMGDLNDVAWSSTTRLFQRIGGLRDPRVGRGMYNTFHARLPFLRWPLDHIFCSPGFALCELSRLPAFGSDHFPIHARFRLNPAVDRRSEADAGDHARAREKTSKEQADPRDVP